MDKIAILIKTIYKERVLYNCIESIQKNLIGFEYKIYIADDGPVSTTKYDFYMSLRNLGHIIIELPFNTGASKSRNILLSHIDDEKYILRLDDDFEISHETNIKAMKQILDSNNDIGIVADLERQFGHGKGTLSGRLSSYQGELEIKNGILYKRIKYRRHLKKNSIYDIEYFKCDLTRNMLLIKREVFEDISWDDMLLIAGEHTDFMLQIKKSKWELVFTTNSVHYHREDIIENDEKYNEIKNKNYNFLVRNKSIKMDVFEKKWGIEKEIIKRPFWVFVIAFVGWFLKRIRKVKR